MIPLEVTLALVGTGITVGGSLWATISTVGRGWVRLERRFDELDRKMTSLSHREDLNAANTAAIIERISKDLARLDNRLGISEDAISSLTAAMAKYTEFKPRGGADRNRSPLG